jgi:type VI secretion system secreted protein VgrG
MLFGGDFSQENQYLSISTPLGKDKLILREIEGEESISGPFLYRLKMLAEDEDLSFDRVIGKSATVTILVGEDEDERYINGIITRFELSHYDEREKIAYYEAELRPWLWLLTLSGDCRIFQEKSVPEIVEEVCKDAGYSFVKKSLSATYAKRDYCVQYGETDFNFVTRLLEEEGIFYFFKHAKTKHELVLGDGSSAFQDCPFVSTLKYRPTLAYEIEDECVTSLRYEKAVTTKGYGVDSFNFETPATDLYTKAQGTKGVGMRSLYTGNYEKSTDGERYAKVLMQAAAAPGELVHGSGKLRSLAAGYKIKIKEHPRSSMNGKFVLHRVRVEASRTDYLATFEAFPTDTNYRPRQTAAKPRIHSSQTAIVVGKSGEEIWVDKYGRIKVQFHWDRVGKNDEKSSCWMRVSQNWAGKSFGMFFMPRIGQEVIVSFLDGDPDRPIVTGAVYNAEQTVPYGLPANATKSGVKTLSTKDGTGKFNEIRFEDKKDAEEIYIHAQKDMNIDVLNDVKTDIKHDFIETVKNDFKTKVEEGNYTLDVVKGTRALSIKGKETHINSDAFEHEVAKDYVLKVDGNLTITVTGDVTLKGKSLTFQSTSAAVAVKSSTETTLEAGTAMTVKSGTDMAIKSGTGMAIDSGMALDLKSKMAMGLDSTMGLDLKAKLALNAQGLTVAVKGQAASELSASGMLTLKGALTKIN